MSASDRQPDGRTKVRENAVRRRAQRQGLVVQKSPRRDPQALGYGTYHVMEKGRIVFGDEDSGFGCTLAQVERYLGLTTVTVEFLDGPPRHPGSWVKLDENGQPPAHIRLEDQRWEFAGWAEAAPEVATYRHASAE